MMSKLIKTIFKANAIIKSSILTLIFILKPDFSFFIKQPVLMRSYFVKVHFADNTYLSGLQSKLSEKLFFRLSRQTFFTISLTKAILDLFQCLCLAPQHLVEWHTAEWHCSMTLRRTILCRMTHNSMENSRMIFNKITLHYNTQLNNTPQNKT